MCHNHHHFWGFETLSRGLPLLFVAVFLATLAHELLLIKLSQPADVAFCNTIIGKFRTGGINVR